AATGADGKILKALVESYEFRVPSDRVRRVLSEGVLYAINVTLQKPGAYQTRVAVRDQATGKVGSANQFLEIPDLHKRRFALTSLVLQDGDRPAGSSGLLGMSPARRQFHPGGKIEYLCLLQKAPARLDARIRILRGDKEIFSAPAEVVEVNGSRVVTGL